MADRPLVDRQFTCLAFDSSAGVDPLASLFQARDGNFHGTASEGGINDYDTAFRLLADGAPLTTIHSFTDSSSLGPNSVLLQVNDGNLYGTVNSGGTSNLGTVFELSVPKVPVITSPANVTASTWQPFTYQITATNSPTSYATSSAPSGLSFDAKTGKFSGTLTNAGTYKPLLSATNSGGTGSTNLNLTVEVP